MQIGEDTEKEYFKFHSESCHIRIYKQKALEVGGDDILKRDYNSLDKILEIATLNFKSNGFWKLIYQQPTR